MSTPGEDDYQQAVDWLLGRVNYERTGFVPYRARHLKLDRMRRLLHLLGDPDKRLRIVHVAGTKGKGSTCAMIAAMLRAAGYRVGVYSSPHLERFEERIALDGEPIAPAELVALVDRFRPLVAELDAQGDRRTRRAAGPTFFDIATAMAFDKFADAGVDVVVLEVGLGGRLDSTNVCLPLVSVITSIGWDHMQQLGSTLEAIAGEKAGIIKPGVPVISGVTAAGPRDVIHATARRCDTRILELERDFTVTPGAEGFSFERTTAAGTQRLDHVRPGLLGQHQVANAAVALATIAELDDQGIVVPNAARLAGVAAARVKARVELFPGAPPVVVDTAHNESSARALAAALLDCLPGRPRTAILSISRDKEADVIVDHLAPVIDRFIVTAFVNNPRAIAAEELAEIAANQGVPRERITIAATPVEAWRLALAMTPATGGIVVTGSFFLAAELRALVAAARQSAS